MAMMILFIVAIFCLILFLCKVNKDIATNEQKERNFILEEDFSAVTAVPYNE
jgi:hypothetical protein